MAKAFSVKLMVLAVFAVIITCTCGCTSTYTYDCKKELKTKLVKGKGVAVATPENGKYGEISHRKSGERTADAVKKSLKKYSDNVAILPICSDSDCFASVDEGKYKYLFVPKIEHWEERATEWSGLPDRIIVSLDVYDTVSQEVLFSELFTGKSKWFTFGGDHPQDLLDAPLKKIMKDIYGK